jgi:hypothetical protein
MCPKPTRIAAISGLPVLMLAACAGIASAGAVPVTAYAPMRLAAVEVIDRSSGEHLPIYGHRGERWVAGVPGHRYAIAVHNRTDVRLLAVMSVDGLNVLSGETRSPAGARARTGSPPSNLPRCPIPTPRARGARKMSASLAWPCFARRSSRPSMP